MLDSRATSERFVQETVQGRRDMRRFESILGISAVCTLLAMTTAGCSGQCATVKSDYKGAVAKEVALQEADLAMGMPSHFGIGMRYDVLKQAAVGVVNRLLVDKLKLDKAIPIGGGKSVPISLDGVALDLGFEPDTSCEECFRISGGIGGKAAVDIPILGTTHCPTRWSAQPRGAHHVREARRWTHQALARSPKGRKLLVDPPSGRTQAAPRGDRSRAQTASEPRAPPGVHKRAQAAPSRDLPPPQISQSKGSSSSPLKCASSPRARRSSWGSPRTFQVSRRVRRSMRPAPSPLPTRRTSPWRFAPMSSIEALRCSSIKERSHVATPSRAPQTPTGRPS